MKRLRWRETDRKIYEVINLINRDNNGSAEAVEHYCGIVGIPKTTLYMRIYRNTAFGLQYNKKAKVYYVNTDKPKTLESIAEKHVEPSTRPKTLTSNERIEYNQSVINERLHEFAEDLQMIQKVQNDTVEQMREAVRRYNKAVAVIKEIRDNVEIVNERLTNNVDRIQDDLSELRVKQNESIFKLKEIDSCVVDTFEMTFFQRLRWLFTGRVS